MNDSILIFACDHRKNVQWDLPYLRIGGPESDCFINIQNDDEISKYSVLLGEGSKIWYVWKHIEEFGNPEYVGFFHYRRFLACIDSIPRPIVNIDSQQFNPHYHCLNPIYFANMFISNNIEFACPFPILLINENMNIAKRTYVQDKSFPISAIEDMFNEFKMSLPNDFQNIFEIAYNEQHEHLCNIFIMNRKLFTIYCKAVFHTLINFYKKYGSIYKHHQRCLGFYQERLTSLFLHCCKHLKIKGLNMQMLTVNAQQHIDPWTLKPIKGQLT